MPIRLMRAKYEGQCARCGDRINQLDRILWNSTDKRTYHRGCPVLPPAPVTTYSIAKEN